MLNEEPLICEQIFPDYAKCYEGLHQLDEAILLRFHFPLLAMNIAVLLHQKLQHLESLNELEIAEEILTRYPNEDVKDVIHLDTRARSSRV